MRIVRCEKREMERERERERDNVNRVRGVLSVLYSKQQPRTHRDNGV